MSSKRKRADDDAAFPKVRKRRGKKNANEWTSKQLAELEAEQAALIKGSEESAAERQQEQEAEDQVEGEEEEEASDVDEGEGTAAIGPILETTTSEAAKKAKRKTKKKSPLNSAETERTFDPYVEPLASRPGPLKYGEITDELRQRNPGRPNWEPAWTEWTCSECGIINLIPSPMLPGYYPHCRSLYHTDGRRAFRKVATKNTRPFSTD
jgi:hypothetical protein